MKHSLLILLISLVCNTDVLSQQRRYDVSFSSGFYQGPKYEHAISKTFLSADFDFHLTEKLTLSTMILSGKFDYFEDWRSNTFDYENYTNAQGYESHLALTLSYSVIKLQKFTVQIGSGLGLFTQRLKYPYREPSSGGSPRGYGGNIFTAEESFSILELPIKLDSYYMFNRMIGVGIKSGAYYQPGKPLLGFYIGPQIRVRL